MTKRILFFILLLKAFLMLALIGYGPLSLAPDEAQYWTWSQDLSLGYYSKPPGIAWQMALTTAFLGNSELGIRFGAVVISFLIAWFTYFLAKSCQLEEETSLVAALLLALSPLGLLSSLLATTDSGFILFWTLALAIFVRGLSHPNYPLLGLIVGMGSLFKWPIFVFWPLVLLWKREFSLSFVLGVLISLFGLLPSLYWNATHDFATFRHVGETMVATGKTVPNPLEFIGAQLALFSPILFFVLLFAYIDFGKKWKELPEGLQFCGSVAALLLLSYMGISFFKRMQGNWCAFAYPPAFVILAWYGWQKKVVLVGAAASLLMTASVLFLPLPYSMNPFRGALGWKELSEVLEQVHYDASHEFLASNHYQTTSLLSYYNQDKKRAFFLNLQGSRKNQFSYWEGLKIGESGLFIWLEPKLQRHPDIENRGKSYRKRLQPHFGEVEFLGVYPFFGSQKAACVYRCRNYQGNLPDFKEIY